MTREEIRHARSYWTPELTILRRYGPLLLGAVAIVLLAAPFSRVFPEGYTADDEGNTIMDATCASVGTILTDADGTTQNLTAALHWVTCAVEDCYFCEEAACASPDGIRFPAGFAGEWRTKAGTSYCRSVGSAGDLRFSKVE